MASDELPAVLDQSWPGLREIHEAGALLVRPDGYIACRHDELWDDGQAVDALRGAPGSALDRRY